jgi:SpoVK/Ycf46/Vps4 family AAA+-type ATPase
MQPDLPCRPQEANANPSCWAQADNAFYGINQSHDRLPAGIYRGAQLNNGTLALLRQTVQTDRLVRLPDSPGDGVVEEVRRFRKQRAKLAAHGFIFKRNILLWGPPGSGKTATIDQVCSLMTEEEDGVAFFIDHPRLASDCLQLLRRIEPDRPVLAILEDLDALTERHGEHEYLALLDGEFQIDNVVTIASTNYPERLDRRFVDRPGRFATIRYVGMPTANARGTYLSAKMPDLPGDALAPFIEQTAGFSIDYLRELIYLTQCEEIALNEAVEQLRGMMQRKPDSARSPERHNPGFWGEAAA